MRRAYELKLADGRTVEWSGSSGPAAALGYVDIHREATVLAWREPRHGLFIGAPCGFCR